MDWKKKHKEKISRVYEPEPELCEFVDVIKVKHMIYCKMIYLADGMITTPPCMVPENAPGHIGKNECELRGPNEV